MTSSAEIFRSAIGFQHDGKICAIYARRRIRPRRRWEATTCSTAGSARTTVTKLSSFCRIAWKEMLWSGHEVALQAPGVLLGASSSRG